MVCIISCGSGPIGILDLIMSGSLADIHGLFKALSRNTVRTTVLLLSGDGRLHLLITTLGDVVRIAPNDLVFLTPQAYTDIYASTIDRKPAFIKSHMLDTGDKYEGLPSERDLDTHRTLRKKMSPEFSPRALKKFEPVIHEHVDELIYQLQTTGKGAQGIDAAQVWNGNPHRSRQVLQC